MTDSEQKLLVALVKMVDQYLDEYCDEVDSLAESAGEHAIEALADFGLMENIDGRFGRWTEAGKKFRKEYNRIGSPASPESLGGIRLVGKSKPES
jgi:hypothetical protein